MAEPYLDCPSNWLKGTLEPNPKLGLVERVGSGSTPSTSNEDFWDGDILWLTPKEITRGLNGLYVTRTERNITVEGLKGSAAKLLAPGTVMLSKRAPVGAVAVNAVPMATNQGFLNFTCGPKLRPLYLAYWFVANKPYLDLVANGSTYPELYKGDLFEFEISVPSIEEQDRTIAFLNALEFTALLGLPLEQSQPTLDGITKIQQQTNRLRRLRETLLVEALSGRLQLQPAANSLEI